MLPDILNDVSCMFWIKFKLRNNIGLKCLKLENKYLQDT